MIGMRHRVFDDHGGEKAERMVQARQMLALLVENIEADRAGNAKRRFAAALERFDLHRAQG